MPRKIRELKRLLERAGFYFIPAKRSHSKWIHPKLAGRIVIAGKDGSDARLYLEKQVDQALENLAKIEAEESQEEQG
ncbi:MAG TPA: type II toxin-antitoxin system HicA family toxin [Leptolyngbya sp.]|jgi:predicted RNA binding protein YcfA (HicA-like mRNA interferase family)|nr:type II toxin-antitoxin system HicA family toxin [Leptolyngbya sp.]